MVDVVMLDITSNGPRTATWVPDRLDYHLYIRPPVTRGATATTFPLVAFERRFRPTRIASATPPRPPPCDLADAILPMPPQVLVAVASRLPWLVGRLGASRPRRSRRRKLRTWER